MSYKINLIASARFIVTSLANFVGNLTEEIYKIKCKDCKIFVEYKSVKDNSVKYKCACCNRNYPNKNNEN